MDWSRYVAKGSKPMVLGFVEHLRVLELLASFIIFFVYPFGYSKCLR
jgi:hypothetical protein